MAEKPRLRPDERAAKFTMSAGSSCLIVDEVEVTAKPVGLVHNKDFMRKVLVGKVGAAF